MRYRQLHDVPPLPPPYPAVNLEFWDNDYLSRSLLLAHLAPDADGASRTSAFMDRSAHWIASLCPAGGRLLDVGCGPGLYARRFYDRGLEVTGLDFSRRSIAYAREDAEKTGRRITYLRRDYLTMDYCGEFDAAVLIYCDYGALSPQNRSLLLQRVRRALRPGGLFVVDAFTARQYDSFENNDDVRYWEGGFWSPEPYVCIKRERVCRGGNYLEQYFVITAGDCRTFNLWNHAFTPEELEDDLAAAGFSGCSFFGDAAGAPLEAESRTLCCVAYAQRT